MPDSEDAARMCWAKIERLLYYRQPGPSEETCAAIMSIIGQAIMEATANQLAASPATVAFVDQSLLKRIRKLEVQVERLKPPGKDMVTVCASCLKASCWQGAFYCEEYRQADITQKSIAELTALGLDHPDYWKQG